MAVLGKSTITELNILNTQGAVPGIEEEQLNTGDLKVEGGASIKENLNIGETITAKTYENLPRASITSPIPGVTILYDQVGNNDPAPTDGAITPNGVLKTKKELITEIEGNYTELNQKIDDSVDTLNQTITENVNTINDRIDEEVANINEKLDNVTVNVEEADANTQGITYLYKDGEATNQDNGAITPKAVDTKITKALEDYDFPIIDQSGQSVLKSWRKSIKTTTSSTASIQIENYDEDMQVTAYINGMALSADEPKIEYTLDSTGLVTTTSALEANQDFMVIAFYTEVVATPPSVVVNNKLSSWRKTIISSGDTNQILSIQIPDYNPNTMVVLAYLNGFTLSDGTNSDLVEYTVSDTGLVSTVNAYPKDQDFMVIVLYYGDGQIVVPPSNSLATPKYSLSKYGDITITNTSAYSNLTIETDFRFALTSTTTRATTEYFDGWTIQVPDIGTYTVTAISLNDEFEDSESVTVVCENLTAYDPEITISQVQLSKVTTPVINYDIPSGSFTITCDTENAIIKYSLNDPNPINGSVYSDKVTISSSPTMVYAIATLEGYEDSDISNYECKLKVATPVISIV